MKKPEACILLGFRLSLDPLGSRLYRDSGIRTHDLLNPIQVRYQLRYVPDQAEKYSQWNVFGKGSGLEA